MQALHNLFASMRSSVRGGTRQRLNWTALLALALLVAVGVLGYHLVSGPGPSPRRVASNSGPASGHPAGHRKPTPAPTASHGRQPAAAAQVLSPVSAEAFGPGGAAQGDNPQLAQQVITGGAWHTDWYASAAFGNMQGGTGLLLDMGKTVTITKAQIMLGSSSGANLQLRAGNTPSLASLPPVAGADNAGGVLQLSLTKPVTCRYVLIWFTNLPPDSSGTFEASVSGVRLQGQV